MMKGTDKLERDFPDWLNPMLVKELRQGLKSRVFLISFVAMQVFLALYLVIAGVAFEFMPRDSGRTGLDMMDSFFWFFIAAPLLVLLPMRGSSALGDETDGGKIDLLTLSRLGHLRLVLGKWVAVNAVSLLFVLAVSPYLIARYFLGFNTSKDVAVLAVYFILSLMFSAMLIGYSGSHVGLRRLLMLVLVVAAFSLPHFLVPFFGHGAISGLVGATSFAESLLFFMSVAILVVYWLSVGMWHVSHSAGWGYLIKRFLVLLLLGLFFLFISLSGVGPFWGTVIALVVYAALLDIFSEPMTASSGHAAAVSRVPWVLRFLARALYPGWMWGALFFSLFVFALVGSLLLFLWTREPSFSTDTRNLYIEIINSAVAVWVSFLTGAVLAHLFFRKLLPHVLGLFLYQALTLVSGLISLNLINQANIMGSVWVAVSILFPFSMVFYPLIDSMEYASAGLSPAAFMGICGVLLLGVLHFMASKERKRMAVLELAAISARKESAGLETRAS